MLCTPDIRYFKQHTRVAHVAPAVVALVGQGVGVYILVT